MQKTFFKKHSEAKAFAKTVKNLVKVQPVFEIGPNGGKNFKGYNVISE